MLELEPSKHSLIMKKTEKYLRIYNIFLNYVKITTKKTNTKGDMLLKSIIKLTF